MSQPNKSAELAEARIRYEEEVEEVRYNYPHDGGGNCTSSCFKDDDCPIIPFEEWLEEQQ